MSALFTVSSEATSTKQNRGDDDKAPVDFRYLPTAEEIESVDWLKSELDKRRMTEDFLKITKTMCLATQKFFASFVGGNT